jgi:hypothetical protein
MREGVRSKRKNKSDNGISGLMEYNDLARISDLTQTLARFHNKTHFSSKSFFVAW